jgi:hypothetical protein
MAGGGGIIPLTVRVTDIFRHEEGAWRLIHRFGDQVTERTG